MYIDYTKYLNLIVGKKGNIFNDMRAKYLLRYLYILSFYKILEFINFEDDCDIEMDGNAIYNSLTEVYDNTDEYNQNILKSFLIDVIHDNIQIYSDSNWIYQLDIDDKLLQNKLSEQSELEKQIVVKKLTSMKGDELNVHMTLQNIGDSNWYADTEKAHQNMVDKDLQKEYTENMLKNDSELQILEEQGFEANIYNIEENDEDNGYADLDNYEDGNDDEGDKDDDDAGYAITDIHFD